MERLTTDTNLVGSALPSRKMREVGVAAAVTRIGNRPRKELLASCVHGPQLSYRKPIRSKNWLHVGSPQAGPKVAAILSVVESCRRMKVPVRDYLLATLLPGLADSSVQTLPELTPAAWAAHNR